MKKKSIYVCVYIVVTGILIYLVTEFSLPPSIEFSHDSGFYNDEFYLEMSSNYKGKIYYTLDGSDPNENSYLYNGPILIYDRTNDHNTYSMRTDVSTGFDIELINKYGDSFNPIPGFEIPDYNIEKCFVLKAFIACDDGRSSEVYTKVYYVNYQSKDIYDGIDIINIITDPHNLFDYSEGIYVKGKTFDDNSYKLLDDKYWRRPYWYIWEANYNNETIDKIDARIEYFHNNKLVLSQECGVKIHGNASQGYSQKSFNLYAIDSTKEIERFKYSFFNDGYYPSSVILFNGGNGDNEAKIIDYLYSMASSDLKCVTYNYIPCICFINGEYWGYYLITEKFTDEYFEYYYNVSRKNTIMIKDGEVEIGDTKDVNYYNDMVDFCSTKDMKEQENYLKLQEVIDLDSYIDYYCSMMYLGRYSDWPNSNYALWRTKRKENKKYCDCKWRWIMFDFNSSNGATKDIVNVDSLNYVIENDAMFANIMQNDDFKNRIFNRLIELGETTYSYENISKIVNDIRKVEDIQIYESNRRFYGNDSYKLYTNKIDLILSFFKDRGKYVNYYTNGLYK